MTTTRPTSEIVPCELHDTSSPKSYTTLSPDQSHVTYLSRSLLTFSTGPPLSAFCALYDPIRRRQAKNHHLFHRLFCYSAAPVFTVWPIARAHLLQAFWYSAQRSSQCSCHAAGTATTSPSSLALSQLQPASWGRSTVSHVYEFHTWHLDPPFTVVQARWDINMLSANEK